MADSISDSKVVSNSDMPKFEAGQSKPRNSGRKKGVPNRKTTLLLNALDELGQTLPERIAELIPKLKPEKQVDVYLELMQYVFPKRKAVEFTSIDDDGPQDIRVVFVNPKGASSNDFET